MVRQVVVLLPLVDTLVTGCCRFWFWLSALSCCTILSINPSSLSNRVSAALLARPLGVVAMVADTTLGTKWVEYVSG